MPRAEAGSLKAIGNKIKSVGLQKLRWYCQMCQKQCRDENGFKCHTSSEAHLRQMKLFADNPGGFLDEFSRDFEKGFMRILSHRHSTKRVKANSVYQEYIADKQHVHMNATTWGSLTAFLKYLEREGKAVVEETEKGWFMQWVDKDPATIARQALLEQRKRDEIDDEERTRRMIEAQILAAGGCEQGGGEEEVDNSLQRQEGAAPIALALSLDASCAASNPHLRGVKRPLERAQLPLAKLAAAFSDADPADEPAVVAATPASALHSLMQEEQQRKVRADPKPQASSSGAETRLSQWAHEGIVVKIMHKTLSGGKYHKCRAVLRRVVDDYVCEVELLDGGARLRLDQENLRTVLPRAGQPLLVLQGRARGCRGRLLAVHEERFCCDVAVEQGPLAGQQLAGMEYDDVCKLHEPSS